MNIYSESAGLLRMVRSGKVQKYSIIYIQWPSGNSNPIRFHEWIGDGRIMGCGREWDNSATTEYDLSKGVLKEIIAPGAEGWVER